MSDPRSYQVAAVADSLLEPLLPLLEQEGWGAIQLPPAGLDAATAAAWLEQVAEHVAEFRRTGYAVVVLDDGLYEEELAAAGLGDLPRLGDEEPRVFLRRQRRKPS